jgi:hypothetical protein
MIEINNIQFKTQKALTEYIKNKIYSTGETNETNDLFFYELIKRHPNYTKKIQNMKSLGIEKCFPNNLRLFILNNDDTITEISWYNCISGKPKPLIQTFKSALRTSIEEQIYQYKIMNTPAICDLCNNESEHIDHINHFDGIANDFINKYSIIIPTEYTKKLNTFHTAFFDKDNDIKVLFQEYHKEVAKLRPLCKNCNLTRPKLKKN